MFTNYQNVSQSLLMSRFTQFDLSLRQCVITASLMQFNAYFESVPLSEFVVYVMIRCQLAWKPPYIFQSYLLVLS